MSSSTFDLVIVGGGPAGLAAATVALKAGASVAIVDNQQEPGGQIYRAAERRATASDPEASHGAQLARDARDAGATWLGGKSVWQVTPKLEVMLADGSTATRIQARRLLLATGAQERPMPIPGWTLPGVMTAGAGQIMLKSAKTVPEGEVWIAGCGPLVLLLAWQWLKAGVKIRGVLDTTPQNALRRAARYLPSALPAWRDLRRGVHWRYQLQRAGIRWIRVDGGLKAAGGDRIERVQWQVSKTQHQAKADALFLHNGVIPHSRLLQALGGEMVWDNVQRCFAPRVDEWYSSSVPGVAVAGDGSGIAGAVAAELQGSIAALAIIESSGFINRQERDERAKPLRKALGRAMSLRPFLNELFRPPHWSLVPTDDAATVCRCECVTAGQLKAAMAQGATSAQEVKLATRCGMGPCQGRQCATTLQELVAVGTRHMPELLRMRSPIEPISLGEWASLSEINAPAKS